MSNTIHFQTIQIVGYFLFTILSKTNINGLFILHFQTAHNKPSHCFCISLGVKILIFVFLNFNDFALLIKSSGYKSQVGVSHKSLAKIILFIVSSLSSNFCLISFSQIMFISSSFFSVRYCWNLYLDNRQLSTIDNKFSLLFDKIVNLFGNLVTFSHKNSVSVFLSLSK